MIGYFDVAARQVLGTRDLIGKNGGKQIVGVHSLKLRGNLLAAAPPPDRKRSSRVPPPAYLPHWRRDQRLDQQLANRRRTQISKDFVERKTVSRAKRQ